MTASVIHISSKLPLPSPVQTERGMHRTTHDWRNAQVKSHPNTSTVEKTRRKLHRNEKAEAFVNGESSKLTAEIWKHCCWNPCGKWHARSSNLIYNIICTHDSDMPMDRWATARFATDRVRLSDMEKIRTELKLALKDRARGTILKQSVSSRNRYVKITLSPVFFFVRNGPERGREWPNLVSLFSEAGPCFIGQSVPVLFVNVSPPRNSTCGSQSLHHVIYVILWKLLFLDGLSYFVSFFTNDYVMCGSPLPKRIKGRINYSISDSLSASTISMLKRKLELSTCCGLI